MVRHTSLSIHRRFLQDGIMLFDLSLFWDKGKNTNLEITLESSQFLVTCYVAF